MLSLNTLKSRIMELEKKCDSLLRGMKLYFYANDLETNIMICFLYVSFSSVIKDAKVVPGWGISLFHNKSLT